MYVSDLEKYFNRKYRTIQKAIIKMLKVTDENYRYKENGKYIISKEGIEWLCKNCFKQKYLELLEEYKMELTEKYIEAGYIYDNFFGCN
jgi:nicotinic acid phosphoribosyltransferase